MRTPKLDHGCFEFAQLAMEYTIYRGLVGSTVHGLVVESEDDRDEMGILIEPPQYLVGTRRFEQYQFRTQPPGVRSGPGDLDLTIYGLKKWIRLAGWGNPTMLLLAFVPESQLVEYTAIGKEIMSQRERLITRSAADRYIGYMDNQRARMLGEKSPRTNRPELIEKYGWDVKYGYHAVRLGIQGIELLTTGNITLPVPEPDRSWLLAMRRGEVPQSEMLSRFDDLQCQIADLRHTAPFPEYPDWDSLDDWLVRLYKSEWERLGLM